MKVYSISYLNSIPFVYGLEHSKLDICLSLDIPSVCAEKLKSKEADLALVPIAIIPSLEKYRIVSPFCISSDGVVQTVCLFSDVPLEDIDTILLDYHSKTSNALVQLLCQHYWKISPKFVETKGAFETTIKDRTAGVIIGDRAYQYRNSFNFNYDLSEEWKKYSGLPFVFACWLSTEPLSDAFEQEFSSALQYGITHLDEALSQKSNQFDTTIDKCNYLNEVISYELNDEKRKSMQLFLELIK